MEKEEEIKKEEPKPFRFEIPICCREGWKSCPHTVKPIKKQKVNIGL